MAFIIPFIPAILGAVGAAGAVVSAVSASNQAKAAGQAGEYNAQVANNNALAARQQADANDLAQRRQAAVALGRERAAVVQSGQGLDGTGADLYAESSANAELDSMNTRYMGDVRGQGLDQQSTLFRSSAGQYARNASGALVGGALNAGSAALSGYAYGTRTSSRLPVGSS